MGISLKIIERGIAMTANLLHRLLWHCCQRMLYSFGAIVITLLSIPAWAADTEADNASLPGESTAMTVVGPTAANISYEQITIIHPSDDSTVFDNNGIVNVQIIVSPEPTMRPGDRVQLFLDGQAVPLRGGKGFTLEGIDRGTHQLQAQIVNANGEPVIESNRVTFHMWHASRLFRQRHQ
jgi:hypothetical protein